MNYHSGKEILFLDLNMRIVSDIEGNALKLTWKNIANQYSYNVTFSAPLTITKWWGSYTNLTAFHTRNIAEATDEIEAVDLKVTAASIYTQHTFSLPWKLKFELSGWASTPSVWGGVFRTDANYSISAGISKKFLNDKANLKISMGDLFNSAGWEGRNEYGAALYEAQGRWDSRRLRVNFSYFFGNDKVKSRKRKTGLDGEKGRAGSSGGEQGG
jgi:iron complex outermembrane receptor protein